MPTCRKSHAKMLGARTLRNCGQVGDVPRGAGPSPAAAGTRAHSGTPLTNATGSDVSQTVTATANLVSGPDDYFTVNIWYDALFGTFAFQQLPLAEEPRIAGTGATPGREVILEAGGLEYRSVAGPEGSYQFRLRGSRPARSP